MHGLIFAELKRFVEVNHGAKAWEALVKKAGLENQFYMPVKEYPDAEATALLTAACNLTGLSPNTILESFGEFITPTLMKMYGHLAKPEWRTLDFILNAEQSIHTVVRVNNPGAKPPQLQCTRMSPVEIMLRYNSPRKMCALANGIVKGVAKHYGEKIALAHMKCMHQGAKECEISVRFVSKAAAAAIK